MHVVGLDTASDRWHAVQSDGTFAKCGPLTGKDWKDPDARRQQLYASATFFFRGLPQGAWIFAEEPIVLAKNGKTTRLLGLSAGAIWSAHLAFSVFWSWTDIAHWKKRVVGKGNATKDEIREFVEHAFQPEYDEQDFFDAHCLMLYGLEAVRGV